MNAQEVYETVKDWPREAWPDGVRYDWNVHGPKTSKRWLTRDDFRVCDVAELAFEAAGMRWLAEQSRDKPECVVKLVIEDDGQFAVDANDCNWYLAPTRLAAISAAVLAVKGKQ